MEDAERNTNRYNTMHNFGMFNASQSAAQQPSTCKECKLRFVSSRDQIPPPPDTSSKEEKEKELAFDYVILSHASDISFSFDFCPKCGEKLIKPQRASAKMADLSSMSLQSLTASVSMAHGVSKDANFNNYE